MKTSNSRFEILLGRRYKPAPKICGLEVHLSIRAHPISELALLRCTAFASPLSQMLSLRILFLIIACTIQRLLIATILTATVYHANKKVLRREILWISANFVGGGLSFPALCFELPGSLLVR
ncbi:hypothetical protein F5Y06DRAFT_274124 [Hypoxylon sp. FL0890]|nr:hypothetical protein F5Y06DRAFT_274124 [Hypoxylon sp. FL0890]